MTWKKFKTILIITLIFLIGAFVVGQIFAFRTKKQKESVLYYTQKVSQIIEINSLKVTGLTEITESNLSQDSLFGSIKNKLFGQKFFLQIPYTAKYGVDLQKKQFEIIPKKDSVVVRLPYPELLSLEMDVAHAVNMSEKGILVSQKDEQFLILQQKLYTQKRTELEKNTEYLDKAKENLQDSIQKYFSTEGKAVTIEFSH